MMSSEQHRARAAEIRKINPRSRAAELHDTVASALEKEAQSDPQTDALAAAYTKRLEQSDA